MSDPGAGSLIDSNVLLDVFLADPTWGPWSRDALSAAADSGPLVINPVVYAEVSVSFSTAELLTEALSEAGIVRAAIPWPAAFLAGRAFVTYRRRGGTRRSPLPDFFIGAHAAVLGVRLLTRDAARYRGYFPTVDIVAP